MKLTLRKSEMNITHKQVIKHLKNTQRQIQARTHTHTYAQMFCTLMNGH